MFHHIGFLFIFVQFSTKLDNQRCDISFEIKIEGPALGKLSKGMEHKPQ